MAALAVRAETISATYLCERGVDVPVIYINPSQGEDPVIEVLMAEGRLIQLEQIVPASGARYGRPSDGSFYEWWEHQGEATLNWVDSENDETLPIYKNCVPQE